MARGSPRTSFDSSRLIRALSDLVSTDATPPRQSFADRLGQWLDFADAIALFSALNGSTDAAGGPATAEPITIRYFF